MTSEREAGPTRAKQRRIDPDVQDVIERMALRQYTPSQIQKHLALSKAYDGRVPHIRTIRDVAKAAAPPDLSEAWSLMTSEPEHVAAGLDMLATVSEVHWTDTPPVVSKSLVETVALLRHGRPGIPPLLEWCIATMYVAIKSRQEDTLNLDAFLAYEPWRGWDEQWDYFTAVHERRITAAPTLVLGDVFVSFMKECMTRIEPPPDAAGPPWEAVLFDSAVLREQIPFFDEVQADPAQWHAFTSRRLDRKGSH